MQTVGCKLGYHRLRASSRLIGSVLRHKCPAQQQSRHCAVAPAPHTGSCCRVVRPNPTATNRQPKSATHRESSWHGTAAAPAGLHRRDALAEDSSRAAGLAELTVAACSSSQQLGHQQPSMANPSPSRSPLAVVLVGHRCQACTRRACANSTAVPTKKGGM